MFNYRHYVPILKGKDGEFRSLSTLALSARRNLTPFIDIPRRDLDITTNQPKDLIDAHLEKKAIRLLRHWGTAQKIFVDVYDLDLDLRAADGTHFVNFLFSRLRHYNIQAIPVIGLDRSEHADYLDAVKTTISTDKRGICIRLLHEDVEMPSDTYSNIDLLIRSLGLSKTSVHMLMDLRSIYGKDPRQLTELITEFLSNLPHIKEWQTITLSASGFPENLGDVSPRSTKALRRMELDLRDHLMARRRAILRFPTFSDYGICHPDLLDFDPRVHTPSASIRYTTERDWLIIKAGSIKKYSYTQFRELSKFLRRRPEYYGESYSWGDKYISDCADRLVGKGNLTTWRQVGTNHHITLVCNQIANSPSI